MFYDKVCQVEQYSTIALRYEATPENDGMFNASYGAPAIYLKRHLMTTDPEDTNGERISTLQEHDNVLTGEIWKLQADLKDLTEFMSYLARMRQAWVDFHNAAVVLSSHYKDDDQEGKLHTFLRQAIVGSDRRLSTLEDEIHTQHEAMSVIRYEIRNRRKERR